jgi:4-amino-4-deoxy-L-arabinose transferase-like glycosyltransferase
VALLVVFVGIAQWAGADLGRRQQLTTFDETFYTHLGMQVLTGGEYSTRAIYEERKRLGRQLPALVNEPLFIHPPLFPTMIAASHALSGNSTSSSREDRYHAAVRVSVLAGSALLLAVFAFGRTLLGNSTALLATALTAIDLNRWIATERVWIDAALATLAFTALWLGLALLAKYPAALVVVSFGCYALMCERHLLRSPHVYAAGGIALLLLSPWLATVASVYGPGWWQATVLGHGVSTWRLAGFAAVFGAVVLAAVLLGAGLRLPAFATEERVAALRDGVVGACCVFLAQADVRAALSASLDWQGLPNTGWETGFFAGEPWYFYLKQHIAHSPLYLIALATICRLPWAVRGEVYLALFVAWVLVFGIVAGNFQSRYVVMMVPALALLNANTIAIMGRWALRGDDRPRPLLAAAALAVLAYGFAKAAKVVHALGYVQNVAYY